MVQKTEPTPVESAGHVPTSDEPKDSEKEKLEEERDDESREEDKTAISDVQVGKSEQVLAADEEEGAKVGVGEEDKTVKVQQTPERPAEEGEIMSKSPTPNSRQQRKEATQRCYTDNEQPSRPKKEKEKSKNDQ